MHYQKGGSDLFEREQLLDRLAPPDQARAAALEQHLRRERRVL